MKELRYVEDESDIECKESFRSKCKINFGPNQNRQIMFPTLQVKLKKKLMKSQ